MATTVPLLSRSDASLRSQYDQRSYPSKAASLVTSLFRQALYSLTVFYHRMTMTNRQYCGQPIQWSSNSQGLVVLLHGLRNDPAAWYSQLSLLKREKDIDVFAPVVPERGMCSLDEAATPVLPTLLDYIEKNPEKPVCILGVSNGSRVATWLETKLRAREPCTPIMVSTIAGVHLGSSRMDLLIRLGLARYFYPSSLQEELKYKSETAINLLNQVRHPLLDNCAPRKYEFYATTEDLSVPDLDSSLPEIGKGEHCHVVHGQSHDSIVQAVALKQISSCLAWIRTPHSTMPI